MKTVLNLILSHQPAPAISRMLTHWNQCVPNESILIAYGGTKSEFDAVQHKQKFFVDDRRLRTHDHQRDFQSYTRLFQAAAEFLEKRGDRFRFVHFAEYDHLPLVPDLNERQIERLTAEGADFLAFHVHRVHDTNNPHFLYHVADDKFMSYTESRILNPEYQLDDHALLACSDCCRWNPLPAGIRFSDANLLRAGRTLTL
jgi:hypothetical protein